MIEQSTTTSFNSNYLSRSLALSLSLSLSHIQSIICDLDRFDDRCALYFCHNLINTNVALGLGSIQIQTQREEEH